MAKNPATTVIVTDAPMPSGAYLAGPPPPQYSPTITNPYEGMWARCSQQAHCSHCNAVIHTETKFVNGTTTHLACFGIFWLTGCCCCIPYFVDSLKDVQHSCPNCKNVLGHNTKNLC